ncbi:MAG TPA: hypothetical protein VLA88_02880 [Candidatus Saccharimonadales bacterium]|nr:hypothetical protein [Candidatus Saccharimonadales bacterium]
MDQQLPTPTAHPEAPDHLNMVPNSSAPNGGRSLAIALVVSAVFLLAAVGIATWLMLKPTSATTVNQPTGDGSANVTHVSFVTPADLPVAYARRDENTHTTQTTFYDDKANFCGITTAVLPAAQGKSAKDVMLADAAEYKDAGITVATNAPAGDYAIADIDGNHTYTFNAEQLDQDIAVPGVPFTKQTAAVAYKQFGSSIATIGFSCKADAWEAKKPELEALIKTFKVKTER